MPLPWPCPDNGVLQHLYRLASPSIAVMSAPITALSSGLLRQTPNGWKYMSQIQKHRHLNSAAKSAFTYRLGVASAAKRTPPRSPKLGRDYWDYTSTQEDRRPPYIRSTKRDAGEDAFFVTTVGASKHHVAFGVADGVGGWQDQGIDPSDFSHGLCGLMAGTAYIHEGLKEGINARPQDLLQTAYDAVLGNPRIIAGGCTASLAVVDEKGGMETAKCVKDRELYP